MINVFVFTVPDSGALDFPFVLNFGPTHSARHPFPIPPSILLPIHLHLLECPFTTHAEREAVAKICWALLLRHFFDGGLTNCRVSSDIPYVSMCQHIAKCCFSACYEHVSRRGPAGDLERQPATNSEGRPRVEGNA